MLRRKRQVRKSNADSPDFIELVTVPAWQGALLQNFLEKNGIEVLGEPCVSLVTRSLTDYRLSVKRQDFVRADGLLREFG